MSDIKSPGLLYLKGALLLLVGVMASALLVASHPDAKTVLLLGAAIWGFSRAYYFAFYVIEHYIDPTFKFSGLLAFARYIAERR